MLQIPTDVEDDLLFKRDERSELEVLQKGQRAFNVIVADDNTGDTDSIQEAINMLPANGGSVFIKAGIYPLLSTITINKANVQLIGSGYGSKITTSLDIPMISAIGYSHLIVDSLFLYGSGAGKTLNNGLYISSSNRSVVMNCYFENIGNNSIYFYQSTDCIARENEISGCYLGILISATATNCIIINNYVHSGSTGIHLLSSNNNFILNNICSGLTAGDGINLTSADNILIVGNICQSNNSDGIQIDNSDNCIIFNNICKSNSSKGIYLHNAVGAPNEDIIVNNICLLNTAAQIDITNGTDIKLSHNITE